MVVVQLYTVLIIPLDCKVALLPIGSLTLVAVAGRDDEAKNASMVGSPSAAFKLAADVGRIAADVGRVTADVGRDVVVIGRDAAEDGRMSSAAAGFARGDIGLLMAASECLLAADVGLLPEGKFSTGLVASSG